MEQTLKQVTLKHEAAHFVGRRGMLVELAALSTEAWPFVVYIHGIPGVGKSALINIFASQLRAKDGRIILLDAEAIEPTAESFLDALSKAAGDSEAAARTLIAIDNFEHLLLLDDWLREEFLPTLSLDMRLILISRLPPNMGWKISPTSQSILKVLELPTLSFDEVAEMLEMASLSPPQMERIASLAQGHPMTLMLAVAAVNNAGYAISIQDELTKVLHELARFFLKDIESEALRGAVELAALARRLDKALLSHVFPRVDVNEVYDQLAQLPFVETRSDGLKLHQVIAGAVLSTMEFEDPDNVLRIRRAIWRFLHARDLNSGREPTWRSTADMIYLMSNPVVREAFFPTDAPPRFVDDARADDAGAVLRIAEKHDGPEMAKIIALWWQQVPSAFRIVRDERNQAVGYYIATDNLSIPPLLRDGDPLLDAWMSNAEAETQGKERSIFLRRWLSLDQGEGPSAEQGASWIDVKRSYLEMRPDLRRVYVCAYDPAPYGAALAELQFQILGVLTVEGSNNPPTTAMLDFGPGSVDGWLSRLVTGDLNTSGDLPFDFVRREIVLDGIQPAAMTKREFEVVRYLVAQRGIAVTRDMLLDDVWGQQHHGGSNVVDVVIRSLRKKLGPVSSLIETVRGVGYRIS